MFSVRKGAWGKFRKKLEDVHPRFCLLQPKVVFALSDKRVVLSKTQHRFFWFVKLTGPHATVRIHTNLATHKLEQPAQTQ